MHWHTWARQRWSARCLTCSCLATSNGLCLVPRRSARTTCNRVGGHKLEPLGLHRQNANGVSELEQRFLPGLPFRPCDCRSGRISSVGECNQSSGHLLGEVAIVVRPL